MLKKLSLALWLLAVAAAGQTTTTVTGTIKDLAGNVVTSGQVTFDLKPGADTTISGSGRFVPTTVTCQIDASGQLVSASGSGGCVVTQNTALTPAGTYYLVTLWPSFVASSKFNWYAVGSSQDLTTAVPTPATAPAYTFADTVSNQTIGGNKTFSGSTALAGGVAGTVPGTTSFAAISAASAVFTGGSAQEFEQVRYSDEYDWAPATPGGSLVAGSFSVITPAWSAVPAGLTSGALTIVSASSSSPNVAYVSGDKFNCGWAVGKAAILDGTVLAVAGCADSTHLTLSGNAPRTTGYGWLVVGLPTPVRISGGTGSSEAMDVTGVGAECPGGTAVSICGVPAAAHSGAWAISSATNGQQEAINSTESSAPAAGTVVVPAGAWTNYWQLLVSHSGVTLAGQGKGATEIINASGGSGISGVLELNVNRNSIGDLHIHGSAGSGIDAAWLDTTGNGGFGGNGMARTETDGAAGTTTDWAGSTIANSGIYVQGQDGFLCESCQSVSNAVGVTVDAANDNGGGSAFDMIGATDCSFNSGAGVKSIGITTGMGFAGGRFFSNGGPGIDIAAWGAKLSHLYMEANVKDIHLQSDSHGVSITDSSLEMSNVTGATCFICSDTAGSILGAITVRGVTFTVATAGTDITSLIDLWASGSAIGPNAAVSFAGDPTVAAGLTFETGSSNNTFNSFQFDSGAPMTLTNQYTDGSYSQASGDPIMPSLVIPGMRGINFPGSVAGGDTIGIQPESGTLCVGLFDVNCGLQFGAGTQVITAFWPASLSGGASVGGGSTINKILTASVALTYAAISAQSCEDQTVTVTGAATTGVAKASPSSTLGSSNLAWSAWISAANTVSVRLCNPTAASITPSAVAWNLEVVQ